MENNRWNQKVSDIKARSHFFNEIIDFARYFFMSDLIGEKLEGNLVLNIPTAFNKTITTTGGNLHFTVNPLLIIIHIDLFVEHSLTTVREI